MLVKWLNGGCSPLAVTDVIQLKQCSCTRCSFLHEVQWWCGEIQLPSGVQWRKGAPLVSPAPLFYLGKKCWALPPGWSNFQWDAVILSVTQCDSMAISRRHLPGGRVGCGKIKNDAPPGFNGWPISRLYPTEIRITAPPSTDGDRIDTFYHTLYCNVRLIIRCDL